MRKPRILTIGNAAMTYIFTAERFPEAGETLVSEGGLQIFPGGKGLNAALCCARLGTDAVLCTRTGGDGYAKKIAEFCAENTIDTRFVFFDSDKKTDLVQVFRAPGEISGRTIVFPGAGAALSPDNVEEAFTCYPDGVYICGETAAENIYFAVSKAKEQKIPAFLNLTALPSDFDPHSVGVCEVLLPDEEQTEKLTGIAPTGADNALRAAIKLSALIHNKYVVIRLGKRGLFVYDGLHREMITALDVHETDTSHAGDAFAASLAARYLQNGGNISDAARFAACVGAFSVTQSGTDSFPTVGQLEEFINRYNER